MDDIKKNYTQTCFIRVSGLARPLENDQLEAAFRRGMIEHSYDWSKITVTIIHEELSAER